MQNRNSEMDAWMACCDPSFVNMQEMLPLMALLAGIPAILLTDS